MITYILKALLGWISGVFGSWISRRKHDAAKVEEGRTLGIREEAERLGEIQAEAILEDHRRAGAEALNELFRGRP